MGRDKKGKNAAPTRNSTAPGALLVDMSKRCCLPVGRDCYQKAPVKDGPNNPDAVRMVCSNASCPVSHWAHEGCIDKLEAFLAKKLANSSRGRNWSRPQVQANMWTHKYVPATRCF